MITCALWDMESRELDRRPRGPKDRVPYPTVHKRSLSIHLKTWSHPLSQPEPSILMLYIPLTVLIRHDEWVQPFSNYRFNSSSDGGFMCRSLVCSI